MTQPSVEIREVDNGLGVLPPSAGRIFALIGTAAAGPLTPATFARQKDIAAVYQAGPLAEAAAYYIDRYGKPVVLVRSPNGGEGAGTVEDPTLTGTGTTEVTLAPDPAPADAYAIVVKIVKGGAVGTTGITYQVSLDGGRTYDPTVYALGAALTLPVTTGIGFVLTAGGDTLVAGDKITAQATAPTWDTVTLGTALDALAASSVQWEQVHVVGALDSDAFDLLEARFAGLDAAGKYRNWIGSVRLPNAGESEAAYRNALDVAWSAKVSRYGAIVAGGAKIVSGLTARVERRPLAYAFAALQASVSEEANVAEPTTIYALPGVSIRDVNGNPDEHDESINPGLDDLRFVTARTIDGYEGIYINRPRLFSSAGSDYQLVPHRRVINLAKAALRLYFIRRLNKPVLVDRKTGFILETEALEIEAGANEALRAVLLAKPKASGRKFILSRTDNLLATRTLTGEARITPLAYPEFILVDVGYYNPVNAIAA